MNCDRMNFLSTLDRAAGLGSLANLLQVDGHLGVPGGALRGGELATGLLGVAEVLDVHGVPVAAGHVVDAAVAVVEVRAGQVRLRDEQPVAKAAEAVPYDTELSEEDQQNSYES